MVSCESDSVENVNSEITGYKLTYDFNYDDPAASDTKTVTIGNLSDGKLFSETTEQFVNGVSQGVPTTNQRFFYVNNRLDHKVSVGMTVYYYYDANGNLVGATGTIAGFGPSSPEQHLYERYVHLANNIIYCESVSLPYNDPNTVVGSRKILQRDAEGNVISAGIDPDLDGIASNVYHYTYNDGDLISMQKPDGSVVNVAYSNVIDSYSHLEEFSCGKQVRQFPCAHVFANGNISAYHNLRYSKHVPSDDVVQNNYQLMPDNFYFKKTFTSNDVFGLPGQRTEETEFFF